MNKQTEVGTGRDLSLFMNKNLLFNDQFISKVSKKYSNLKDFEKPWIVDFVSAMGDDPFVKKKDEIESFLKELDEKNRKAFIKKFTSDFDGFLNTYHELGVGISLKKLGFDVDYEKQILNKTPDWFISKQNGNLTFIVEVFTSTLDPNKRKIEKMYTSLSLILSDIPIGVIIKASWRGVSSKSFPIDKSKIIKNELKKWLEAEPHLNEKKLIENIEFKIDSYQSDLPNVNCIPANHFGTNINGEFEKIENKVNNYKNLGYPLLVAVVALPNTFRFECEYSRICYDFFKNCNSMISGLCWTLAFGMNDWEFVVFRNPNASTQISPGLFGKDTEFKLDDFFQ